ncbi:CRISPR-associated protein Cas4 [Methanoplanus sp. FWC-SCC4]|uniref:CRISPR-associated exonuclease Cas4 n=1 Tax=Methanochimaera problematica TaxID=2609417 RepID=A0AA97I481_9EURY|nr:CRISPR-associated protein Cas4 [Methanoplanus sp. FWC-SCC4]WOF16661.1 CRISPR-associated protein Cas4 [Methanoplanus sp. FWC-SCC4]
MTGKSYADDELLSLSGIQHFYFCKRQWALIHVERQWEDNLRTTEGHFLHERVDDPFFFESRGDVFISRAFPLVSHSLGLFGIADVVEYIRTKDGISVPGYEGLWTMRPVEYKRGKPKTDERDEVQLCAQAMCLEEMFGVRIESADFYYHEIRRRVHLNLDDSLWSLVSSLADEMHEIFDKGVTPPAEKSKKCSACSLENVCMPKITIKKTSVAGYVKRHVDDACKGD